MDGVLSTQDNCPAVHNPGQENEDGDGRGDACDNCPVTPNPAQENTDGDALGDLCDPRASTPGDFIAFFDGFNGTSIGPEWTVRDGQWTVGGGALHQGDPTAALQPLIHVPSSNLAFPVLQTAFTMTECTTLPCRAGPILGLETDGNGFACSHSGETSTAGELGFTPMNGWLLSGVPGNTTAAPHPGTGLNTLRFHAVNTTVSCTHLQSGITGMAPAPMGTLSGGLGLRTRRARAAFNYVIVYGR